MTFKDHLRSAAQVLTRHKRAGDISRGATGTLPAWVIANLHPLPPMEMAVYAEHPDIEAMFNPRRAEPGELDLDETTLVFSL